MRRFGKWWWLPVIALICCGAMALFEANRTVNVVKEGALAALDGVGLGAAVDYAGVDGFNGIGSDGLHVVLEGPASAEEAAVAAVAARSEVDRVTYRITEDDTAVADPDPEESEPEAEAEPEPAVELAATAVSAIASADAIRLEGVVPDAATRDALIAAAVAEYGAPNVTHELTVDLEAVTLEGGTLVLTGEATSPDQQSGWVGRSIAVADAGGLEFIDQSTLKTVDQSLNDLFALEPIEFDVNRATIRSLSEPTLNEAAELINANPDVGRLLVVGHTDSDGSAQANLALSNARAQAVVDYLVSTGGVDPERLDAEGRGETELLVDPEVTPEDKQRNRRIAWELLS